MRRVFVTGIGVVSPLGIGTEAFFRGLREARVAIRRVEDILDLEGIRSKVGAPVMDFDPRDFISPKKARRLGRATQFALAAAHLALREARLDAPGDPHGGVIMGTGIGPVEAMIDNLHALDTRGPERVSPFFVPTMMPNATAAEVGIEFGLRGPNTGVVTACASGGHAIGLAWHWIRAGVVDWALAGGTEAVMLRLVYAGFDRMGALSRCPDPERASRPFDANRDGFVMGEGACVLVLESEEHLRARGGEALAELVGFGASCDAYHITAPPEDGAGARRAMEMALRSAGLSAEDVDYINAHGTSTPLNDRVETRAIKALFGERAYEIPVSSTKSQIGHLLGAAGAVEAAAAIFPLLEGLIPATVTWRERDPECDLDYVPGRPRPGTVRVSLSNSFGFGGQNACLLFRAV
ncbi:beta-ketoacyl-ACP synthase II [Candidatus Bipolaricaulota sp. J31]